MKAICIYHSVDLDGWMSAAIVKHWFKQLKDYYYEYDLRFNRELNDPVNSIDFLGWKYGDNIPDLKAYDQVIMCDLSFPKDVMLELWATKGLNFIWIDHHSSAMYEMKNAHENISSGAYPIQGLRNVSYSACELTWQYFFPNDPIPEIVRLLGRYDSFGHKGTDEEKKVLEFQYGARQCIANYNDAYKYMQRSIIDKKKYSDSIEYLIQIDGRAIYKYLCTEAQEIYKRGFPITLQEPFVGVWGSGKDDRRFLCINRDRFNPINFGIDYHKDGYDGIATFYYDNGAWNFSLYNDNGLVDCSAIAKLYGGGGHKGASGFIVKDLKDVGIFN